MTFMSPEAKLRLLLINGRWWIKRSMMPTASVCSLFKIYSVINAGIFTSIIPFEFLTDILGYKHRDRNTFITTAITNLTKSNNHNTEPALWGVLQVISGTSNCA